MMRLEFIKTLEEDAARDAKDPRYIDHLTYKIYMQALTNMDAAGASSKTYDNWDGVMANSGRFPYKDEAIRAFDEAQKKRAEGGPDTTHCPSYHFDFRKSAWYLELKEMPEELLLPGEAEMIAKWK
jgi:hypothetical protein